MKKKKEKPLTKEEARKLGLTSDADYLKRGYRMRTRRVNTHEFKKHTDPNKKILVPPRDVVDGEIQKYGYKLKKKKKMNKGGKVMKYNMGGKVPTYAGMPMMAEGGMVKKKKKVSKKKSIDGVARRGRTKGRMV